MMLCCLVLPVMCRTYLSKVSTTRYGLRRISHHFDAHMALNVAQFAKKSQAQPKETELGESNLTSVLTFLKKLGNLGDSIVVH